MMHVTVGLTFLYYYVIHCLLQATMTSPLGALAWPSFCPRSCTCGLQMSSKSQQTHKTVICDGEVLTTPPSNMSSDVETLILTSNRIHPENLGLLVDYNNLTEVNLAHNHIYGLGDVNTYLHALLYLTVDGNEMDYLANKTFWWSPHLRVLSIRSNKIELMHADAFSGLVELRSLDLSGNRLFAVIPNWFRDLRNLENLFLGQNNIHVLRDSAFHFLGALRSLDLSHNELQHIYDGAFKGLRSLQRLSLQGNNLKSIPLPALQMITNLKELNLNSNPFTRLDLNAIANLSITYLTLSYSNRLNFIDRHSFVNLPLLQTLEIAHNKLLKYIDPESFYNLPRLRTLILKNNNLSVFEKNMMDCLPSVEVLAIEGNELFCDCSLWWLIDEYRDHVRNLSLPQAQSVVCAAPPAIKDKSLDMIQISQMSKSCAPRILPLFAKEYHIDLGDPLRLDCRAVGKPTPKTDWLLPVSEHGGAKLMVLKTVQRDGSGMRRVADHISISLAGTVFVDYAQGTDTGDYTCLASNPQGRDERTARVSVKTNLASIIIMRVSYDSITITWRSTSYQHQYQILYHKHKSNETYHSIKIQPYMRSFTANGLSPHTPYQFCIAMQQGPNTVRINCTTVNTKRNDSATPGLFNARNYIIGGATGSLILVLALVCTVTHFVKRYNLRKRQEEELYSDNLSQLFLASMDSMSDTTPITYENRGAEMFDEDDIEEIRSTASMPSCSTNTTVIK